MHSRKKGALVLAFFGLACLSLQPARAELWEYPDTVTLYDLRGWVALGVQYDCYFTVEEYEVPGRGNLESVIYNVELKGLRAITNRDDLIQVLRKQLKGVTVLTDKNNLAVIHIVDDRLDRVANYGMGRRMDMSFAGTLFDLLGAIEETDKRRPKETRSGIKQIRGFPLRHGIGVLDAVTKVKIEAKDQPLRRILTDYIPLSDYHRLIWWATNYEQDGKRQTFIEYRGQCAGEQANRLELVFKLDKSHLGDFGGGQVSYFLSERYPGNYWKHERAIAFIEAHMKGPEPRQVRWAMFYLGREKAEGGIPVLLKHLDYRYTTCALLEESYPALKALVQYGPPAAQAALEQLPKETSELRLQLLTEVLLRVEGPKKAKAGVDKLLADSKDEAARLRLTMALKHITAQTRELKH